MSKPGGELFGWPIERSSITIPMTQNCLEDGVDGCRSV